MKSLIKNMSKIEEVLTRGVEQIYPSKEELEKVLRSGKRLRIYQGFDPSMPNLHLGNYVGLVKLRQFQNLGHEIIFLVGDFTGMIGDPTDKSATRTRLTRQQTLKNSQSWKEQAGKILKFNGENPAKMLFNSQWLDKINFRDLIEINSNFTVQQMLERDFFQKRIEEEKPIFLHELLYPVAQAVDSVEMNVDLEIGGNDQTFNMLAGRTLLKAVKGKEKFVLATKLLADAKGNKMGKTSDNALFLNSSPADMFGAAMSFPDEIIILSFELLTFVPLEKVRTVEEDLKTGRVNPMDMKKQLAFEIVKMNFSAEKAKAAQDEFERVFQKRELPREDLITFETKKEKINIIDILTQSGAIASRAEAKRLIEQNSIDVDQLTITSQQQTIVPKDGMIIKVGKRKFIKIIVK